MFKKKNERNPFFFICTFFVCSASLPGEIFHNYSWKLILVFNQFSFVFFIFILFLFSSFFLQKKNEIPFLFLVNNSTLSASVSHVCHQCVSPNCQSLCAKCPLRWPPSPMPLPLSPHCHLPWITDKDETCFKEITWLRFFFFTPLHLWLHVQTTFDDERVQGPLCYLVFLVRRIFKKDEPLGRAKQNKRKIQKKKMDNFFLSPGRLLHY